MLFAAAAMFVGQLSAGSKTELKSGPQVGEKVEAFEVVKCAGNEKDGVKVGAKLCYRCKMGDRPVVMVFARKPDANLTKLTQELDKVVADNADKKFVTFVNLIGTDADKGKEAAEKFVAESKVANVAVVVPQDQPNGPENYKLSKDADVTILVYKKGVVKANHALVASDLNADVIKQVVKDTDAILN